MNRRTTLAAALVCCAALPLAAQDAAPDPLPGDPPIEGFDLFSRGAESMLRGLMEELGPQLQDLDAQLRGLVGEMGPMLGELAALIGDLDAYHPPEKLPNGDIILRRKTPPEGAPQPGAEPAPEGQIDL